MTFRMVAGDRPSPQWRATCRDAIGSPERMYNSTTAQRTASALVLNSMQDSRSIFHPIPPVSSSWIVRGYAQLKPVNGSLHCSIVPTGALGGKGRQNQSQTGCPKNRKQLPELTVAGLCVSLEFADRIAIRPWFSSIGQQCRWRPRSFITVLGCAEKPRISATFTPRLLRIHEAKWCRSRPSRIGLCSSIFCPSKSAPSEDSRPVCNSIPCPVRSSTTPPGNWFSKGVDGLVFVADSQRPMRDANIESFKSLTENIEEFGLELSELPMVLQYNKRDLSNVLSIEELNADLNPDGEIPFVEASAVNGEGVITTLKEVTKLTLKKLRSRMTTDNGAAQPASKIPAPVARPVKSPASRFRRNRWRVQRRKASPKRNRQCRKPKLPLRPRRVPRAKRRIHHQLCRPPSPIPKNSSRRFSPSLKSRRRRSCRPEEGPTVFDLEPGPVFPSEGERRRQFNRRHGGHRSRFRYRTRDRGIHSTASETRSGFESGGHPRRTGRSSQTGDHERPRPRYSTSRRPDLDLDSLLSSGSGQIRELRETLDRAVNSDVFKNMRGNSGRHSNPGPGR